MVLDESGAIPLNDRRVANGGERKPSLIARYQSSKSTARNVRMTLDLGDPDQMAKITPDGRSRIDEGMSHDLEGFGICLTAMVEEDFIHDVTEETNRRSRLAPFREGHVATP